MKISIKPILIVEGKYDKIKLENLVDGLIFCTDGFQIFKDSQLQRNLRTLAQARGAIILTDSDRAGFLIRKKLHDILQGCDLFDVYIPDVFGKESRKETASAEGKLGVEGMEDALLHELLSFAAVAPNHPKTPITSVDLYESKLFGQAESAKLRREFQFYLGLPGRLNKNMLLKVLNGMFTKEQFFAQLQLFMKN